MSILNIINFGLHPDIGWRLMSFIDPDIISRMPLKGCQIDALSDVLNWDILTSMYLPGWVFVKYQDRIHWPSFLINGYPKELISLVKVRSKLHENKHLFRNSYVKNMYYTPLFMSSFPELIDWNWCGKNIQLPDHLLLLNWNNIKIKIISTYQKMSENIMKKKLHFINWQIASKHQMSEFFMTEISNFINWQMISKYQKLSESFIKTNLYRLDKQLVSRYQKLSESFIKTHHNWLNMKIVSRYQFISYEFLHKNMNILHIDKLLKNQFYNHKHSIQNYNPETLQIEKLFQKYY
jgi:hypothetical protein